MKMELLKGIFELTSKRSVLRQTKFQRLNRERLGEAEVRNVMVKILEQKGVYYGIEAATKEKQAKEGNIIKRSALVDLVIYERKEDERPEIFVEFKRGPVSIDKIEKDLLKMMREPDYLKGACFFHILPKVRNKSERSLARARNQAIKKYYQAYCKIDKTACIQRWFILFIMDTTSRKYYLCEKENICNIEKLDNGKWEDIKYEKHLLEQL